MSTRPNPRRETPDRVRTRLDRRASGAAGTHRTRRPRSAERRAAIAASRQDNR